MRAIAREAGVGIATLYRHFHRGPAARTPHPGPPPAEHPDGRPATTTLNRPLGGPRQRVVEGGLARVLHGEADVGEVDGRAPRPSCRASGGQDEVAVSL